MGTARMGNDPKTSVTNSFGQTHDIKNLFLVDGSIFVSASCQNPTWMIMALCWRAMDYVKDEMKRATCKCRTREFRIFSDHGHGFELLRCWRI